MCTLLLKPISLAFRQNKQTPLPLNALLDLRLAFKSKIFDLPRLITTWKPGRRCLSLHFYLPFDSWFYCSCSNGQPMKTRVETDYLRGPCCPFRWTKHADSGNEIVCDGETQYLCARAVAYHPCNDHWRANVLICEQWVWYEILNSASWPFSFIVLFFCLFVFFFHFQPLFFFLLQRELTSHFFKKVFPFGNVSVLQATR